MNINRPILLSLSFVVLFVGASFTLTNPIDDSAKEELMLKTMMDGLTKGHYSPLEINDNFSKKLHKSFLDRLDSRKRFLVADDITQLAKYETSLDEAINEYSYEFFDLSVMLYEVGIARAKDYYTKALKADFDYTKAGSIELDGEKRDYPKNYEAQQERWNNIMKYEVMVRLNNKLEKQVEELAKEERDPEFKEKTDKELLTDAKKEAKDTFSKWFLRMEKTKRQDHLDSYLNSVATLYDPHTNYYAPIEKENFDIRMSGKLEGIGARLQSDGEETKITEVVTGGPAWKEGSLKANDIIIKVAQGDDEEPVDVTGMNINDVVSYIRGKKGTEVNLTVKTTEGEEKVITIIRDVVIMSEGVAKSLILNYKKEGVKNVGYIMLPSFYADFRDPKGRQCANDVAKEIQKLKDQGVKSIILDLRDNGGGSLRDVVNMSGLFIEEGPIVQVKERDYKPTILEDTDSRVLFDGELIVMVNQFSASASEILAAAMQDYNRAVIIGSNSSFGKGTVQRFFDLDRLVGGNGDQKPLGQVKMTIQKFYRINGGSTQLKGVVPDIILPDNYQNIQIGEKEYDYAMEWTQIEPVDYKQNVLQVKNMDKLRSNSKKRVSLNETFQMINNNAARLKEVRDDSDASLNLKEFQTERNAEKADAKQYENIMKDDIEGIIVSNLKTDAKDIKTDEGKAARNEKWLGEVQKDVYIQEALMIMKDMMK